MIVCTRLFRKRGFTVNGRPYTFHHSALWVAGTESRFDAELVYFGTPIMVHTSAASGQHALLHENGVPTDLLDAAILGCIATIRKDRIRGSRREVAKGFEKIAKELNDIGASDGGYIADGSG